VRVRKQGHICESVKYTNGINASTYAQHHTMFLIVMMMMMMRIVMMKSKSIDNVAIYIEKKMIIQSRDEFGQLLIFL